MPRSQEDREIGLALIESAATDAGDLAIEAAAIGIGLAVEGLEGIPVLGALATVTKLGMGYREHLFQKKILGFLKGARTRREKGRFLLRHTDERASRRIGETILLLLERADDFDKPPLLGRLFTYFLLEELDADEMLQCARILDRADMADIQRLRSTTVPQLPEECLWRLTNAGVITGPVSQGGYGTGGYSWNTSDLSVLGKRVLEALIQLSEEVG